MTTYEPSRLDIQNVMPMSGYKAADIAHLAMKAMNRYTIEELEGIRRHYSALRRALIKQREAA